MVVRLKKNGYILGEYVSFGAKFLGEDLFSSNGDTHKNSSGQISNTDQTDTAIDRVSLISSWHNGICSEEEVYRSKDGRIIRSASHSIKQGYRVASENSLITFANFTSLSSGNSGSSCLCVFEATEGFSAYTSSGPTFGPLQIAPKGHVIVESFPIQNGGVCLTLNPKPKTHINGSKWGL